jgi:tripartite ATP-independent transporter DctM subunit
METMSFIMLAIAVILGALGAPIAFILIIGAVIAIGSSGLVPIIIAIKKIFIGMDKFILLAIPLFMLAGQIMNAGGLTKRLMKFANNIVGSITGGLAQVNILASMLFAGMSGSALADVAGLGSILIPAMKEAGYDEEFTSGITAASSIVGPVIPPSIDFIIYGSIAGVSIVGLFIGGALPGIIMGGSLMIMSYIISRKRNYPKEKWPGLKELFKSTIESIPILITPIIILVGMLTSIFTPTEVAAIAVIYSVILGVFVYKELSFKQIPNIILQSMLTASSLLIIIGAASPFGWVISYEQLPQKLAEAALGSISNPYVLLFILNIFLLVLGCFMETAALFILLTPVLVPLIKSFGIDPLHFGIIMVVNLVIGTLTPPFGVVIFAVSRVAGISYKRALNGIMPFYIPILIALLLITYFPQITLFLPKLLLNY